MQIVMTSCEPADADRLATALIERRLAACVTVLPGVISTYRWAGEVQRATEALLWIKVGTKNTPLLMTELARLHPYEVPEIVVWPLAHVSAPYAAWAMRQQQNGES